MKAKVFAQENVINAARWVRENSIQPQEGSSKYCVIINEEPYEPKCIYRRAYYDAQGKKLPQRAISAKDARQKLRQLGFEICEKGENPSSLANPRQLVKSEKAQRRWLGHGNEGFRLPEPPIDRIVVDGNNVAHHGLYQDHGSVDIWRIQSAYNQLISSYGFKDVKIFVGAALGHRERYGWEHIEDLQSGLRAGERRRRESQIIYKTLTGQDDDRAIIDFAVKHDYLILTNDGYKNHTDLCSLTELRRRIVNYEFLSEELVIHSFPTY